MRNPARAIVLSLFIFFPVGARAQRISPAGVSRSELMVDASAAQPRKSYPFAARTLTAALGGTAGAFGLGLLAVTTLNTDCGGCDDPGLGQFIVGFVVGAVAGAGVGAALPKFGDDRCSFATRFWRALGGAAAGSVTGAVIGNTISETSLVVGGSIGTALGASAALIGC